MIQANELRIGNKFYGMNMIQTVISIMDYTNRGEFNQPGYTHLILCAENGNQYKLVEIEPIPLTPDILEKAGFKKYNNAWVPLDYDEKDYNRWRFTIWDQFGGEDLKYNSAEFQVSLNSVHQLQNLYFSLTGKELEINL